MSPVLLWLNFSKFFISMIATWINPSFNWISWHSKLRQNHPEAIIWKNCPRAEVKTGNSYRCKKVRKPQKSICSLKEWGFISQKPHTPKSAKFYLKWDYFWLCTLFQMGHFTSEYTLGVLWLSENYLILLVHQLLLMKFCQNLSNICFKKVQIIWLAL